MGKRSTGRCKSDDYEFKETYEKRMKESFSTIFYPMASKPTCYFTLVLRLSAAKFKRTLFSAECNLLKKRLFKGRTAVNLLLAERSDYVK